MTLLSKKANIISMQAGALKTFIYHMCGAGRTNPQLFEELFGKHDKPFNSTAKQAINKLLAQAPDDKDLSPQQKVALEVLKTEYGEDTINSLRSFEQSSEKPETQKRILEIVLSKLHKKAVGEDTKDGSDNFLKKNLVSIITVFRTIANLITEIQNQVKDFTSAWAEQIPTLRIAMNFASTSPQDNLEDFAKAELEVITTNATAIASLTSKPLEDLESIYSSMSPNPIINPESSSSAIKSQQSSTYIFSKPLQILESINDLTAKVNKQITILKKEWGAMVPNLNSLQRSLFSLASISNQSIDFDKFAETLATGITTATQNIKEALKAPLARFAATENRT